MVMSQSWQDLGILQKPWLPSTNKHDCQSPMCVSMLIKMQIKYLYFLSLTLLDNLGLSIPQTFLVYFLYHSNHNNNLTYYNNKSGMHRHTVL